MKKNKLKIILLALTLTIISCEEKIESIVKADYKIIEVNYVFDNYMKNVRNKSEPLIIKERNILEINVDEKGECNIEGKIINDSLIVSALKKYLIPNPENDSMPQTIEKEFTYSGKVVMNKSLIVVANFNKELDYKKYSEIRNKVYSAFNEVRNEFTNKKFKKKLNELMTSKEEADSFKWNELTEIIPFKYTERVVE